MTTSKPPSTLPTSEYDAIKEALLESARGRWFLDEFSRRNRGDDTQILLDAIRRLESSISRPNTGTNADLIRRDLIEMSEAISRTRQEIAAIKPPDQEDSQLITATEELDAIVEATEKATSDILQAAEDIQEAGWLLRETGEHGEICDKLDQRATDIYMACSFQDITGQRTDKVVQALRFLEARINSMMDIWQLEDIAPVATIEPEDSRPDAHLLNGPQLEGKGLEQDIIDSMIIDGVDDFEIVEHGDADPNDEAAALANAEGGGETLTSAGIDDIEFDAVTVSDADTENPDDILFSSDLVADTADDEDSMDDAVPAAGEADEPNVETAAVVSDDLAASEVIAEVDDGELILAEAVEAIAQASARIEIMPAAAVDDISMEENAVEATAMDEPDSVVAPEPVIDEPEFVVQADASDVTEPETAKVQTIEAVEPDVAVAVDTEIGEVDVDTATDAALSALQALTAGEIDDEDVDEEATAKALADIEALLAVSETASEQATGHDDLDWNKKNALFS